MAAVDDFVKEIYPTSTVKVLPLAGDASSRKYYRIVNGDESAVLMHWEPFKDEDSYPFLSVHIHFARHGVLVPKVLVKDPARGMILLEDLGDLTLERKFWENQNQSFALPYYKQAIDELIKIHYPATNKKDEKCVAFKIAFDVEKLLWELNYGREHLVDKLVGAKLSSAAKAEIDKDFKKICQTLHEEEKRICHRDYHSRNIMILRGQTRIIDFQDARMGPIQYDLVSLIYDSYVDLNQSSVEQILNYYIERATPHLTKSFSREKFDQILKIQTLQRAFKACGSFSSFYNIREDRRYLKYIKNTIRRVRDTLQEFPEYAGFRSIIDDYNLTQLDYENPTTILNSKA